MKKPQKARRATETFREVLRPSVVEACSRTVLIHKHKLIGHHQRLGV